MGKRNLQVLLRSDIYPLGKAGDIVDVKPGYARNYLFPRQLANRVTPGLLKERKMREDQLLARKAAEKQQAENYKIRLETIGRFIITKKAGENEVLFGTVTTENVAEAVLAASGLDIDRRNVILPDEIKTLGTYDVQVRLHSDVTATARIVVTPE